MSFPENDNQFQEHVLSEVRNEGDSWTFVVNGSLCLSVSKVDGVNPQPGNKVRYYGGGTFVRGVFVEGQKVYYKTAAEQKAEDAASSARRDKEKREAFERDRPLIDARVSALPEVFQQRLHRFRDGNPDFRWKFEGYELFTCEQAVVFATACPTLEKLEAFRNMSYQDQLKTVPGMSDGHSGNTFGCAIRLAYWYIIKPENVALEHGAMVPLVGCVEYGCTHSNSDQ
jgi:hypothetical protein